MISERRPGQASGDPRVVPALDALIGAETQIPLIVSGLSSPPLMPSILVEASTASRSTTMPSAALRLPSGRPTIAGTSST
ncbi:hypothetical protein GM708_10275 [Vibrio cholerae]|nr:hypothetical protein [Vibrio cholerae]